MSATRPRRRAACRGDPAQLMGVLKIPSFSSDDLHAVLMWHKKYLQHRTVPQDVLPLIKGMEAVLEGLHGVALPHPDASVNFAARIVFALEANHFYKRDMPADPACLAASKRRNDALEAHLDALAQERTCARAQQVYDAACAVVCPHAWTGGAACAKLATAWRHLASEAADNEWEEHRTVAEFVRNLSDIEIVNLAESRWAHGLEAHRSVLLRWRAFEALEDAPRKFRFNEELLECCPDDTDEEDCVLPAVKWFKAFIDRVAAR